MGPFVTVIESGQLLRSWGPAAPIIGAVDHKKLRMSGGRFSHRSSAQGEDTQWPRPKKKPIRKTTNLMLIHLGVWFFFGFIIHMFVYTLNKVTIPILGFPLGFYMAAQGSLIVFVVQLFLFAKQQDKIDREFGFAEDDA